MRSIRKTYSKIATYGLVVLGASVMALPLYWMLRSSFMRLGEIFIFPPRLWSSDMQWSNYPKAWNSVSFLRYFLNTALITALSVSGTVFTSSLCGYGFARFRFPLKRFWFGLMLTALMLPYAAYLIPTFLVWAKLGALDTYLPLIVPVWFGGGVFNVFLMRQFFLTIPRDFDDAAKVEGAGYFAIYARIMLPLSKPALVTVGLLSLVATWNDFLNPVIYLQTEQKYTLAIGLLQFRGIYSTNWHLLMAASVIVVIVPIVMFLIGQKYFIEGVTLTGVKQ